MPRVKRAASGATGTAKKHKASKGDGFRQILDSLDALQDDEGTRSVTSAFLKLPSKKLYPDYYELIAEPVSLSEITKRLAKGAYDTADLFVLDFQLLHDNAVKYNDPDSWIVSDAVKILDYVRTEAANVEASADQPPAAADVAKMCLSVLDEVISYSFPQDGVLSGPFMEDVDPEEYPDYFKVIENPTSFDNVRAELNGSLFSDDVSIADNLQAFHDATTLIFTNAQTYNDPSSLIHEDSKKLQQVFEDKFDELRTELLGESKAKEPVKLKLNLKAKVPTPVPEVPEQPPKKRRGRKPKKLLEEEARLAALAAAQLKQEEGEAEDENGERMSATENIVMGKTATIPSSDEVFIRRATLTNTQASISLQIATITSQLQSQLSKVEAFKRRLFPEVPASNSANFFNYEFAPIGFSSKAYAITLPQNTPPTVNFSVLLHELIHAIKKDDLVDGRGVLKGKAEEDFMCSLYLNEQEQTGSHEIGEEANPESRKGKLLRVSYDLKLNYGLNIINFELRLSPALSKSMKRERPEIEPTEPAGRHTRHQLQQFKLNWEVEKLTLYVTNYSA